MEEFANFIYNSHKFKNFKNTYIELFITKYGDMNDIHIVMELKKELHNNDIIVLNVRLSITSKKIILPHDKFKSYGYIPICELNNYKDNDITIYKLITLKFENIIKNSIYSFCKFDNCFRLKKYVQEEQKQFQLEYNLFGDYINFNNYDICIICYEGTSNKTYCNHSLCFICIENMDKLICPMCRKNIYYNHIYNNEDSEDETEINYLNLDYQDNNENDIITDDEIEIEIEESKMDVQDDMNDI